MPDPRSAATSWFLVEGPVDEASCDWCRGKVGKTVPAELQAAFAGYHRASDGHACRCSLKPARIRFTRPDPGEVGG